MVTDREDRYSYLHGQVMETSGFPPPVPAALSLEERLLRMEGELSTHKQQLSTHSRLLHCFAERDVIILAAEILKWAVGKRRDHNVEDGRQLYGAAVRPKVLVSYFLFFII
jgi:hypothetical protein